MKTFAKLLALLLASVLCTTGVSAGVIVTDSAGVTYESHKIDDRRLVRYSPDKPEKEFTISDTSVEPYSFEGAKNLEKITITDGVFYIGEYAFKDCTSLKEVVIDKTWGGVVIPENAFDGCTSLDPAVIEELCWEKPFTDIFPQDWYYNAVQFVHQNGLMNGVSDSKFAPDIGMTRAMFVTVLGRLAGVTDVKEVVNKDGTPCIEWRLANGQWGGIAIAQTFTDVEEGQWYTDYVKWGAANGILQGYGNGTFGVDDKVTVEQAAVILYRYAALIETPLYDMEADYTDTDNISAWAMDAMRWITATDIYDGYDGGQLRPKQNAARALVAEMLYNYVRETEKSDEIPEKRISEVENPDWGLTLTASNVTSTGMTLTFTQSGGNVNDEYLNSGAYYFIETYKDGQWTEVEPKIRLNAWTEEGWPIPRNGKFVIEDSWEPLYGELPAGQYRMGKRVSDGLDYATFYAEFTVRDPAEEWGMDCHTEDVTPHGLNLVFTFSGKKPDGDLQHGSDYILEHRKNGEWLPVSEKPFDFTAEAIVFLPKEIEEVPEKVEWAVDWTKLYGELPAGEYRIAKEIMNFRGSGDYDTKIFYAEFTIGNPTEDDWGLTLTVSDVTPTGMTLTFTQSGGNVKGRLQMEREYALEVEKNGNWIPAKYFDDDVTIDWGEGTAFLPVNDTVSDMVSWKWLYGELPEGKYRYVKEIMDFRDEEDFDTKTFYAEFTIE